MTETCKVCKERLNRFFSITSDAMTICDDCLFTLNEREIGRR